MKKNEDTNKKHCSSTADASGCIEIPNPPMTMNHAETTANTAPLDPMTADEERYFQDEIWQMRFQPTEVQLQTLRTLHHDYWRKMDCHIRSMMQFVGKSDDIWEAAENEIKELEKSHHTARDLFYATMSQYSDEWFDQLSPEEREIFQIGLATEDGDSEYVTEVVEDKNHEIEKLTHLRKDAAQRASSRQSGLTKENATLKAQIKALTDNSKTK